MPPSSRAITNARYSHHKKSSCLLSTTQLSCSLASLSRELRFCVQDVLSRLPTSPCGYPQGFSLSFTVFARCYSRYHYCFLFLPVLRCFNSRGSRSFRNNSGIHGSQPACGLPWLIAACHALHRNASLVIHELAHGTVNVQ
jgi:hypothetical protein